jgi:hypothetical protein
MAFFIIQDLFCLELRDSWGLTACSKQHASSQMLVRMPGWSLEFGMRLVSTDTPKTQE